MLLMGITRLYRAATFHSAILLQRTFKCGSKLRQNTSNKDKVFKQVPVKPEEKDLIIYRQEPTNFYRILNIFCFAQFTLWSFVSSSCFSLRDVPVDQKIIESKDTPFWKKINFGESKYRLTAGILSFMLGYSILGAGWFYIYRSVQYIVLRTGRKNVSFVTYSPFTKNRIIESSLEKVSAIGSRNSLNSVMPIKIQGRRFHYVIDIKKGHFPHPRLFDQTVGLKRRLK